MFMVGETVIGDTIPRAAFCCDLKACKGACCTMPGGTGAPLEVSEIAEIQKAYPLVKRFLAKRSLDAIEKQGLIDRSFHVPATPCVDGGECVFVGFDAEGIARCAFELGFFERVISWRKPISCHLFPLRVRQEEQEVLRYEQISECAGARQRGAAEGVALKEFLEAPLTRKYGAPWYTSFIEQCNLRNGESF